jgi:sigma-E factor negative regulatory protein RseB
MKYLLSGFVAVLLSLPVWADSQPDALQWLQRVNAAARTQTYSGVFIYQSGAKTETSRITHVVDGDNEMEHIEVLDGSPREITRTNDEVKCYLPDSHLMIVERRSVGRPTFPALVPASLAGLAEFYAIRKGAVARVAGLESQSVIMEPKDDLRYGRKFWIDTRSGLLVKAALTDEHDGPIETFAFTELAIGGPIDRAALNARQNASGSDWQVQNVRTARSDDNLWLFRAQLPGFRKIMGMRRQVRPGAPEVTHVVFSDGLAAFSVFIEPLGGRKPEIGQFAMGGINVYKRVVGDFQLIAMGDVPLATLKKVADGMEPRQK